MQFIIFILFICFFIALFCIFLLSKDDFTLLRRNISLEEIFNYAFISFGLGVVSARIFYVLLHPSLRYLNPLIFLVFPYFPGLSLTGGIIGVMLYIFTLPKKKKIPKGRLFDIFSLSFLLTLPIGICIFDFISLMLKKKVIYLDMFLLFGYIGMFVLYTILFIKGKLADGIVGFASIFVFCLFSLFYNLIIRQEVFFLFFNKEDILLLFLLIVAVIGMLLQSKSLGKRR